MLKLIDELSQDIREHCHNMSLEMGDTGEIRLANNHMIATTAKRDGAWLVTASNEPWLLGLEVDYAAELVQGRSGQSTWHIVDNEPGFTVLDV